MKKLALTLLLAAPLFAQPHDFTFDDLASIRRVEPRWSRRRRPNSERTGSRGAA